MKRDILTDNKARQLYKECLSYPELVDDLDSYEAKKLLKIAKKKFRRYQSRIVDIMNFNPDYDYPEEYLPNRCFQYWLERTNGGEPMDIYKLTERLKNRLAHKNYNTERVNEDSDSDSDSIESLIQEFAKEFSKNTKYPYEKIYTYLTNWEQVKVLSNPRSRAKKLSSCPNVADGTLKNWEDKWLKYYESRTAK